MQAISLSALLLLLGTAHAMLNLSPTDLVTSQLMKIANLTSQGKTTGTYRPKRQSNPLRRLTADEFNRCQAVGQTVACESGLQQEIHTLALQCERQTEADIAEFSCGVNSAGLYCGQGLEISQQFESATSVCSPFSCSSSCRSAINNLNDELGCCSGYWNQTLSGTNTNLDGNIWSSCSVTPGELCPIPSFNSTVTTSRFCTVEELSRILITHRCTQANTGPIVEAIADTSGCGLVAEAMAENCDVHPNGNLCAFETGANTAVPFIQACAASAGGSSCSSSCRSAMIAFRNDVGCCMNTLYNGTTTRIFPASQLENLIPFFTNSFWGRCNVDTPGFCESLVTLPTTEAPTTQAATTEGPTTQAPTTKAPTTEGPATEAPTTRGAATGGPRTTCKNGSIKTAGVLNIIVLLVLAAVLF